MSKILQSKQNTIEKNKLIKPVLQWVGGKRQLLPEIEKYIPNTYKTYYEPFFGGGAVLFHLQPQNAVVNDVNSELINLYNVIKNDVDALIIDLKKHKNERDYFYKVRNIDRDRVAYNRLSNVERASRIIFLNKTCFNSLFRVNKAGEFNSAFGKQNNPNIVNEPTLRAVSNYFNTANIQFRNTDFIQALEGVKSDSFVYFDPPYDPVSSSSNFTGYDKRGFNRKDQQRLKELCDDLNEMGVKFLLSNSHTDFIMDLYKDYKIEIVKAKRSINSKGNLRGEVNEVLVRNYD